MGLEEDVCMFGLGVLFIGGVFFVLFVGLLSNRVFGVVEGGVVFV